MAFYKRLKSKVFRTRRAVLGFPLVLPTFIAAKLQKNLISFCKNILKCFGIGFHPIEYEMNTTRRWSPLFGSPNMEKILQ